jgi:signal transduction histidine kinase
MKETLGRFKDFIGPYDAKPGFIYSAVLLTNVSGLRGHTFSYEYGPERIQFFLIGLLSFAFIGLPLYLALRISNSIWAGRRKTLSLYMLEVLIGALITTLAHRAGQKYLIPLINTVDFFNVGKFVGEFITRSFFAIFLVALTHSGLRTLSEKLERASSMNNQLNQRYAKLIESDEEIRSHAAQLLHDRIQAKLMLAGAKLTRIIGVLSEEGKLGVVSVVKELESIRAIDVREVSDLLSPNLASEGLAGSCENLCKEFKESVEFTIDISPVVNDLDEESVLGIYRIIEQGIINSIKHGPATKISIEVFISSSNRLVVELKDNGPGGEIKNSGTGTVIIDAWVSILGGEKEIKSESGKGFTLRVTAPVKLGT